MLSRIVVSMLIVVAFAASPANLSARQCILGDGSSEEACQSNCCTNKTCCATSKKQTAPTTQPLAKTGSDQQGIATVTSAIAVVRASPAAETSSIFSSRDCSAHSPPPLALICIRLI